MNMTIKETLMKLAIEEAQKAADDNNFPFGAIIADRHGNVIARARNTQNTDRDPTAHAEINAIRAIATRHSQDEIGHFFMFCNAQSCSMCMSAAIKAGFKHFVFGAPSEPHMEPYLTVSEVLKYCRDTLDVTFGVLEDQCRAHIQDVRRAQGKLAQ